MVERWEGKFKYRSRMETIVLWSARGGSLNIEVIWKPLYGGAKEDESFIEEVKTETLVYGGAQGGGSLIEEAKWKPL